MSADTPSKKPMGLIISIALNGLLIGLLAGVMLAGGPKQRGGQPGPSAGDEGDRGLARAIIGAAPENERRELRKLMGKAWESSRPDRQIIRDAQSAISNAVGADEFDSELILAEFEKWRAADVRVKSNVQNALVDILEQLSPESRQALAAEMKRHDTRRERWRERRERRQERRQRD